MLDIATIKQAYDKGLHLFDRSLLREYLQYQILAIIFDHPVGRKLSFLGGTCLRIVYNLPRFSEDIDFDNKNLSQEEFKTVGDYIKKELEKRGFFVEIRFISKAAFHCDIKFPDLLYRHGITLQKTEKILIQVDTFNQGVEYDSNIFILDKFEFFTHIRVTPKEVILSQKLWTITQRKRYKGRDFFDIMFLLQNTQPDLDFLEAKFGTRNLPKIVDNILEQLAPVEYALLADDVRSFLPNPLDAERIKLFPEFLKQKLK